MLTGLYRAGRVDDAKVIWDRMIDVDATPDIATYHIIFDGLYKNKYADVAMIFSRLLSSRGYRVNIKTFTILIYVMFSAGHTNEARDLFNYMFAKGLMPDIVTYTIILKGLIKKSWQMSLISCFHLWRNMGALQILPCLMSLSLA